MNAKEMFEKLGFKKGDLESGGEIKKNDEKWLVYSKDEFTKIFFNLKSPAYYSYYCGELEPISLEEHLAIHQQLIELGWIPK